MTTSTSVHALIYCPALTKRDKKRKNTTFPATEEISELRRLVGRTVSRNYSEFRNFEGFFDLKGGRAANDIM